MSKFHFLRYPLQNKCSSKFPNIHRKKPVMESLFNKVARQKTRHFIKKKPEHRCFPVKFAKFLGALFSQNTSSGFFCIFTRFFLLDQIPLKVRVSFWRILRCRCFSVIFVNFFRTPVLKNIVGRQLLKLFHNSLFSFE